MATIDLHTTTQDLEAAGADPQLAAAIAAGIARAATPQRGPSPISILAAATALGFTLLAAGMGWLLIEIQANRGLIEANRDRIDALGERVSGLEVSMSERISALEVNVSERLARIETLLEERLPSRR